MPSFDKKLSTDQMSIFISFLYMTARESFPTFLFSGYSETMQIAKYIYDEIYNPLVKHVFGLCSRLFHGSHLRYYTGDKSYDQGTKKINLKKIHFAVPNLQILWDSTEIDCSKLGIINDLIKFTADMSDPLDSFILIAVDV